MSWCGQGRRLSTITITESRPRVKSTAQYFAADNDTHHHAQSTIIAVEAATVKMTWRLLTSAGHDLSWPWEVRSIKRGGTGTFYSTRTKMARIW